MWRKNSVTIGIIAVAMLLFLLTQILPAFQNSGGIPADVPTSGTTAIAPSNPFEKEAEGWLISKEGDTLSALDIELSQTPYEITRGLMHRRQMALNEGMVFEFPDEAPRAFWMKNTILSLDIIYLDAQKKVVSFHENTLPYSEQSLPSSAKAQYVLEVLAGYVKAHNIDTNVTLVYQPITE